MLFSATSQQWQPEDMDRVSTKHIWDPLMEFPVCMGVDCLNSIHPMGPDFWKPLGFRVQGSGLEFRVRV